MSIPAKFHQNEPSGFRVGDILYANVDSRWQNGCSQKFTQKLSLNELRNNIYFIWCSDSHCSVYVWEHRIISYWSSILKYINSTRVQTLLSVMYPLVFQNIIYFITVHLYIHWLLNLKTLLLKTNSYASLEHKTCS